MATSTITGRVHQLGVKLEPSSEVEIPVAESVDSSVENGNDNGRCCFLKCGAAVTSAEKEEDAAAAAAAAEATEKPLVKLSAAAAATQEESCHELKSKTDKIREAVEQVTSEDSKKKIARLLAEVQQLPDVEKLLLYLRLPSGSKVEVDPLKQSFVSSLGNRFEVTQTVTWIQTHLEEDSEVSLPKQEVYDGYCEFCSRVNMKPLSTADFGKVMKQVFPNVRPRRLGTRGNSRYCYAGLRKKILLETPKLPDLSLTYEEQTLEETENEDQELNGAISFLIREWAEKLLERKFNSLKELALHVMEKGYVTGHSVASFTMLSCATSSQNGKNGQHYPMLNQCDGSKHRETRIQLQRKIHERESIREQKKRLVEQRNQGDKIASHSANLSSTSSSSNVSKVSPKKIQNVKTAQPDTLRKLLSNSAIENGDAGAKKRLEEEKCCTTCDNAVGSAALKSETTTREECVGKALINFDSRVKLSPLQRRRGSCQSAEPSPIRRRSGGTIGESRSPKQSTPGSGWGTPITDVINKSRLTPGCEISSSKSGKVLIPRVTARSNSGGGNINCGSGSSSSQSSKLCFPSTNIIIIPQLSAGVPMSTEFNGAGSGGSGGASTPNNLSNNGCSAGGQKSKYKLIQPKPCILNSLNEVKNTSEGVAEKDSERAAKSHRRGNSSQLKRSFEEKDEIEANKSSTKGRKRSKHSSEPNKSKSKRACISQQKVSEDVKSVVKEDDPNDGPRGEMNITTLEQDALLEYLNDSTPSAEQEDELVRYFGNGDDNLAENNEIKTEMCGVELVGEQTVQLSRLRLLLEQNFKSKADASELALRRELPSLNWESPDVNYNKDNNPIMRLILGDERSEIMSDIQSGLSGNTPTNVADCNLNGALACLSSSTTSQANTECASLAVDTWRQGINGDLISSTTRNSDEILMSSDSSSGCYPSLSNGNFISMDEGLYERVGTDRALNHQQLLLENNNVRIQFNPGATYLGHVSSNYSHPGNGNSSVPPSPNTRRRAFDFQPISPLEPGAPESRSCTQSPLPYGPMLPTVRTPQTPFVSPRSTPSIQGRSRHDSGATSSALGTPRATPHSHHSGTDQSSCLASPFVSPHPTPVPFTRSRHNSNQQQQRFNNNNNNSSCTITSSSGRSRHPSEITLVSLLSPNGGGNSAPMSPLEAQQQQSHSSITHPCDTVLENQFNNNRSRHNSNSNYASLILPPPPPLPLQSASNLNLANLTLLKDLTNGVLIDNNWQAPANGPQESEWITRQIDPRLLSRHRHASVGSHLVSSLNSSFTLQGLNSSTPSSSSTMVEPVSQEVAQLLKKVEPSDLQGVANRSRSVPIFQMLQHMIQQAEPPIHHDVMMSHSYPATPTGQSTSFNFCGSDGGGDGSELGLEHYHAIEESDEVEISDQQNQAYRQQQQHEPGGGVAEANANDGNNLRATLDIETDQFPNIIPSCPLEEYMLQEFSQVELDQCFATTTASSTHH